MASRKPQNARRPGSSNAKPVPTVNLWPRRIITGTGLLLIIALIIWGIIAGVSWLVGTSESEVSAESAQSQAAPKDEITRDGIVHPDGTLTIPECGKADLEFSLANAPVAEGTAATVVTITMKNTSDIACVTNSSGVGIMVLSGDETVYDSRQCLGQSEDGVPLLLGAGDSWKTTYEWDGMRYSGCEIVTYRPEGASQDQPLPADPGTYRVQGYQNSSRIGDEMYYEFIASAASE